MPGYVKVGKTTRTPTERAEELSAVTGLPTPFIVVYEQLFDDCDAAEVFIHTLLTKKGYRISENREFFNAPVHEIVKLISTIPGCVSDDAGKVVEENDFIGKYGNLPVSSNIAEPEEHLDDIESQPWYNYFDLAGKYYSGDDDFLQDYEEAFNLYETASKLGCIQAYSHLGHMVFFGEGVQKDRERAKTIYKEGIRRGDYYCWLDLAQAFIWSCDFTSADLEIQQDNKSKAVNVNKCLSKFLELQGTNKYVEFGRHPFISIVGFLNISTIFKFLPMIDINNKIELSKIKFDLIQTIQDGLKHIEGLAEVGDNFLLEERRSSNFILLEFVKELNFT
ncbi:MAG: GIY-YIG nuclease family protein [Magnetococcales bacterium]|nr:GIY-YIG nuclease family protein [Magnetococcales bacterium]